MNANELLRQAPQRRRRRDELFAMVPEFKKSNDPNVVALIEAWEEKYKSTGPHKVDEIANDK